MLRNGLEPWHLFIALAVLLLLFGSKRLPEMARGLGKSMRILKAEAKAMHEDDTPPGELLPPPPVGPQARPLSPKSAAKP